MSEAIGVREPRIILKKIKLSSEKFPRRGEVARPYRKSSHPNALISSVTTDSKSVKVQKGVHKKVGRINRSKQIDQNQCQSLESLLEGKVLKGDQLEKKDVLETQISIPSRQGERLSLSQYLHENGFSYKSQACIVSANGIKKYVINYLVALFFERSENPLMDERLEKKVPGRISCKWGVLEEILNDADMEITVEEAVLNLLKSQGFSYESVVIFLNLFEKETVKEAPECPKYEQLNYPNSRVQCMRDVLEVAKGGNVGLSAFIQTFIKPSSNELSEWEQICKALSDDLMNDACRDSMVSNEDICKKSSQKNQSCVKDSMISKVVLLSQLIKCVRVAGGVRNKQAFIDCLMNSDQRLNGEDVSLYKFLRLENGCGLGADETISLLAKCIGNDGGSKNKQALHECLSVAEIEFEGKKVTLFEVLISKQGGNLSSSEAIRIIVKCIGHGGGAKNKQALIECFCQSEINSEGKKVPLFVFLRSEKGGGFSASEIIHFLVKCFGSGGGSKNKQAFVDSLKKRDLILFAEKLSLYEFLCSDFGGGVSTSEAIQMIVKCVCHGGGAQSRQAWLDCLNKSEIDLDGKPVSCYEFLCSKKGGGMCSCEAVQVITKCVSENGGGKNRQAFLDSLIKPVLTLNEKKVTLYQYLYLKEGVGLSVNEAIQMIVKCISHTGGSKNKQVWMDCLEKPDLYLNGKKEALYTFLCSKQGANFSRPEAMQLIVKCIGLSGGSQNRQALIECFTKLDVDLDGKTVTLYTFLTSEKGCGMNRSDAIPLIIKCIGQMGGSKNKQALIDCLSKTELNVEGKAVSLCEWLRLKLGEDVSLFDVINLIISCISHNGGSKNKQALIDCFIKSEHNLGGEASTVIDFLTSERGGGMSLGKAIDVIIKCVGKIGGSKNKQALLDCFRSLDFDLDGKKMSLYAFLRSERGGRLSTTEAVSVIVRCLSHHGGSQNKQSFIACLTKPKVDLDGKVVSLYAFLCSKKIGMMPSKAMQLIVKCIGHSGGAKNGQVLIECFCKHDIFLDGKRVTLFGFLSSKKGCALSVHESVQMIMRCIDQVGGSKNMQAFIDVFVKSDMSLDGKMVTLYEFLSSKLGFSMSQVARLIMSVICTDGGSKNKQAFQDCLIKPVLVLNTERVTLYAFLTAKQGGGLNALEAVRYMVKILGHEGGTQNKQAFIECLSKLDFDIEGKSVSFYTYLCSDRGGGLRKFDAIKMIARCVGQPGGGKNKQALVDCFNQFEIDLNGEKVSLYNYLTSKYGCGLMVSKAIGVLVRCVSFIGGAKNKQAFIGCFNLKLEANNLTLYETFLSGDMTCKQAVSLCLMFSINRYALNITDVLDLFILKKGADKTVVNLLNSLNISCYTTIVDFITKVLSHSTISSESKRDNFSSICQSLVDMFAKTDGFFVKKCVEYPRWDESILVEKCIAARYLYSGGEFHEELRIREMRITEWIRQFSCDYRLTTVGLFVISYIKSIDELNLLIALCDREIARKKIVGIDVDAGYCEESLKCGVQILRSYKQSTIEAILKYEEVLLNGFDFRELSSLIMSSWGSHKIGESMHYFFENSVNIQYPIDFKKIFSIYMGLSALTPSSLLPLTFERMQHFFEELRDTFYEIPQEKLSLLYSVYLGFSTQEKNIDLHEIAEGILKMFGSYEQFQAKCLKKNKRIDVSILSGILKKWDLSKDNITQDELSFLIQIGFQLPSDVIIAWSDFSKLKASKKGTSILNNTHYPNWVFALAFLKKVRTFLSSQFCVFEDEESIYIKPQRVMDSQEYRFSLFKIQLHKKGFVLEGENINDVVFFYAQTGLEALIYSLSDSRIKLEERIFKKRKRLEDGEAKPPSKYQKRSDKNNPEAMGVNSRKRRHEDNEFKLPPSKQPAILPMMKDAESEFLDWYEKEQDFLPQDSECSLSPLSESVFQDMQFSTQLVDGWCDFWKQDFESLFGSLGEEVCFV